MVSAACNNKPSGKAGEHGWAASKAEAGERVATIDANVARLNGHQHVPVGVEMDSLALDTSACAFVRRLTRQRKGEIYDVDVKSLYGFRVGLWSTPTVMRHWVATIVIGVAVARERSTRSCQDARREFSG